MRDLLKSRTMPMEGNANATVSSPSHMRTQDRQPDDGLRCYYRLRVWLVGWLVGCTTEVSSKQMQFNANDQQRQAS